MATVYTPDGGLKNVGVEFKKISWPATAATETVTTKFNRIFDYSISPFPGTNTSVFGGTTATNGTSTVTNPPGSLYPTIQGTVDPVGVGGSFGFVAGTAASNTLTLQRQGTAAAAIVYLIRLNGNSY